MNEYIELSLKKHTQKNDDNDTHHLSQAIANNDLIVLLGAPGSGKTSALKQYQDNNSNSEILRVKKFIKSGISIDSSTQILLLDGLDEYRGSETDKTFVIDELASKIEKLTDIKIVISCREMDWYGETDKTALKDAVKKEVALYSVLPLNNEQQIKLAALNSVKDTGAFIHHFAQYGFLKNPQLLLMSANLYNKNPANLIHSKKDLYLKFIKNSIEQNPEHHRNHPTLDTSEILKYVGYIATYYMLCNIDELDENFIINISDADKGYPKDKITLALNTPLFNDNEFIHRTIAEFLLAHFLFNNKYQNSIIKQRVAGLFITNQYITTELRGGFSWLCAFSKEVDLLKIDPYYQMIHGDNSLFDSSLKQEIVLLIKQYADTHPWFMGEVGYQYETNLKGFYHSDMDDFLMEEFNKSLTINNHYNFFISSIFTQNTKSLSKVTKDFIKTFFSNNEINSDIKASFIGIFYNDIEFLKQLLNHVKDNTIKDTQNKRITSYLLKFLYPAYISNQEILPYLKLYQHTGNYANCDYSFLYQTKYADKYKLVDGIYQIYKSYNKTDKKHYYIPTDELKNFIDDYFVQTILKFEEINGLLASDIYKIIKYFKDAYYKKYDNLSFDSYSNNERLKENNEKITRLTNELFSLYADDKLAKIIAKDEGYSVHGFSLFFPYQADNSIEIALNKMNQSLNERQNIALFNHALYASPRDENNTIIDLESIQTKAVEFGFEDRLKQYLSPIKEDWQIEDEQRKKKYKQEQIATKKANEDYFQSKTDADIVKDFESLNFVAGKLLMQEKNRYLTDTTLQRLKAILKNAIFALPISPKYLTLESLANNAPNANRNIDRMYYVSYVLNAPEDIVSIHAKNQHFFEYLYIVDCANNAINILQNKDIGVSLDEKHPNYSLSALSNYIKCLLKLESVNVYESIFLHYIESETSIKKLKKMIEFIGSDIQNTLLNNFLHTYTFEMTPNHLRQLNEITPNNILIQALSIFFGNSKNDFTIKMAVDIYGSFDRETNGINVSQLSSDNRVRLVDYMFSVFNTKESIKFVSGIQSTQDRCASFLRHDVLLNLNKQELEQLKELHDDKDDIWRNSIYSKMRELGQQGADSDYQTCSINTIKEFILSNGITSQEDFYQDVKAKLELLAQKIQDNRDNDKDNFYAADISKNEEACRDVIKQRLCDKYSTDFTITKEQHEANNRVDLNIKCNNGNNYEVQIECKKDKNQEIYTGIPNQLIEKYLSQQVQYGIYLIFDFGEKTLNKEKIEKSIPSEYVDKVGIIYIDLKKPHKNLANQHSKK